MADIKGRDILVGDRVKLKIGLGTVRYVGGLDFQDGTWVGVQVDDESRTCVVQCVGVCVCVCVFVCVCVCAFHVRRKRGVLR